MAERITDEQLQHICDTTLEALYGYVSRRCGGERELAEDITQETWLRAIREWSKNGPPVTPLAWLTTVARNLLFDHLRRQQVLSFESMTSAEVFAAVEANAVTDSSEVASLVNKALTRIPIAEAQLLEAFHFERCKVAQLAEKYGISERAVEGRLRRAREHLRKELAHTLHVEGETA